jgi:hypothetical protein
MPAALPAALPITKTTRKKLPQKPVRLHTTSSEKSKMLRLAELSKIYTTTLHFASKK